MNDFFHFPRFWRLLKKDFYQNWKLFGILLLVAIAQMVLLYPKFELNTGTTTSDESYQQLNALLTTLCCCGSILVAVLTNYFDQSAKGYQFLTLPVARLEKLLSVFILVVVLFGGSVLLFFRLYDSYQVSAFHVYAAQFDNEFQAINYAKSNVLSFWSLPFYNIVTLFLLTIGCLFLGSLFFNKYGAIKAGAAAFLMGVALKLLHNFTIKQFISDKDWFPTFFWTKSLQYHNGNGNIFSIVSPEVEQLGWFMYGFLAIAVWFIAYIRLGEKQF